MHNKDKELVKELLAEKDPETLMRKIRNLTYQEVSALAEDDKFVEYVGNIIYHNQKIREKINAEEIK